MKKILTQSIQRLINRFFLVQNQERQVFYAPTIKEEIIIARDLFDYTEVTYPKYHKKELSPIREEETNILMLKYELNEKNVSLEEKRLYTLKAAIYDQPLPPFLKLIDEKTLGLYNFYQSLLNLEFIDESQLGKESVDKNVDYNKDLLLFLGYTDRLYTKMVINQAFIPIDFLAVQYLVEELGIVDPGEEQITSQIYLFRQYFTAYGIIYHKAIPEDYIHLDRNTKTNVFILRNLLNNILPEIRNPEKVKTPALRLVK